MTTHARIELHTITTEAAVLSPLFLIEAAWIHDLMTTSLARSLKFNLKGHFTYGRDAVFAMSEEDTVRVLAAINCVAIERSGTGKANVERLKLIRRKELPPRSFDLWTV